MFADADTGDPLNVIPYRKAIIISVATNDWANTHFPSKSHATAINRLVFNIATKAAYT